MKMAFYPCAILLALAACQQNSVTPINNDVENWKCSQPKREQNFEGTWFVGLELSVFRNNYLKTPADTGPSAELYDLSIPDQIYSLAHARDSMGTSAYRILFIGHQTCSRSMRRGVIVLDKISSIEAVPFGSLTTSRR
jgi:hypothetical protein